MKLTRLKAKSFGVFYPEVDIKFQGPDSKHLWVFEGLTGSGKTTLFLALIWVLYGESGLSFHTRMRAGGAKTTVDMISRQALKNGDSHMSVELHFIDNGSKYILQRFVVPKKSVVQNQSDYREVVRLKDHLGRELDLENERIREMLPLEASQFFFFAGEVLQKYAEPTSTETRQAIEKVLGFPEVRDAIKDVSFHAKELLSMIRENEGSSQELRKLTRELEELRADQEAVSKALREKEASLQEVLVKIPEFQAKLKGFEEVQALQSRQEMILSKRQFLKEEEEKLKEERYDRIRKLPFLVAKKQLSSRYEALKERIELDSAEARIKRVEPIVKALEILKKDSRCWCGNSIEDFERGNLEQTYGIYKKELDTLVEKAKDRSIPSIAEVSAAIGYLDGLDADYDRIDGELKKIRIQIGDIDTESDRIDRQIKGVPVQEIKITKELLDRFMEKKGTLTEQIKDDRRKLGLDKAAIDEHNRRLAKMQIQSKAVNAWRSKLDVAIRAGDAFEYVLERLIEESKRTIEQAASTTMKTLAAREVNWDRITIGNNYTVELYDRNGEVIPRAGLSDGQKELLALSFIAGLKNATEKTAPVVIDYLLGRLDIEYQDNVAAEMSTLGDQILYLVLDSELTEDRRKALLRQANEWFTIRKDARTGMSEIVAGGSA